MGCDGVREALSANDGRILRGRKLRAHLRHCGGCRDFRTTIGRRRSDLAALAPPLPAALATATLHGLAGGGGGALSGGTGLLGAGGAKALASSGMLKVAAAVLATAAVGVGTAEVTGVAKAPPIGPWGSGGTHASTRGVAPDTKADYSGAGSTATDKTSVGSTSSNHAATAQKDHGAKSSGKAKPHAPAQGQHGTGPPSGAGGGRSFGQQTAQSHAPTLPAQAQGHPAAQTPTHPSSKGVGAGNSAAKSGGPSSAPVPDTAPTPPSHAPATGKP